MSQIDVGLLSLPELMEIISEENVEKSLLIAGWDAGFTEAISRVYGIDPQHDDKTSERLNLLIENLQKGKNLNILTACTLKYISLMPKEELGENVNFISYLTIGDGIIKDKLNILFIKKFGKYTKFFMVSIVFVFLFICYFLASENFTLPYIYTGIISAAFETFVSYKIYMIFWKFLVKSDPSNLEARIRLARRKGIKP